MIMYAKVGESEYTIDLARDEVPQGYIEIIEERPEEGDYIVSDAGEWVLREKSQEELTSEVLAKQSELMGIAREKIELLTIRIKHKSYDEIQDDTPEKISLTAWEKYLIALDDVTTQPNFPNDITWPEMPE